MSIHRQLAGAVALSLIIAACSSGPTTPASDGAGASVAPSDATVASSSAASIPSAAPSDAPTPTPTATAVPTPTPIPTPSPTPTPTPVPTPMAMTLDAHVWWGGYAIDVSGANYDPVTRRLVVIATFLNSSTAPNDVSGLGSEMSVVWNGTYLQAFIPNGAVPAGGSVRGEIQVLGPVGFTPETAVLTFGQPTEHQATIPLNGDPAVSEQPLDFDVLGKVKMGKYATYTVRTGRLQPASCAGSPTRMKFGPMKIGEMSIVLGGIAANGETGFDAFIDKAYLTVPDGTNAAAFPAVYIGVPSKGTVRDASMCFSVPTPANGTYKLTMHDSRSKKNGTITFIVP